MFVMLSVRTSTVHERLVETFERKGNLAIKTSKIFVKNTDSIEIKSNKCKESCKIVKNNNFYKSASLYLVKAFKNSVINRKNNPKTKPRFLLEKLNNFRKTSTFQISLATILNNLSSIPSATKIQNICLTSSTSSMKPKQLQSNMLDAKAMRYYRIWIYTCNAVLLMAVMVFCGVTSKVLIADYRRLLVHGLNLGQPNFIYAYLALLVQSGFLQLVGCFGALKLSEKLLNAYWLLLLVLLIGDVILGIFWMFKFEKIMDELQPILRYRLATEYGSSSEFSGLWDRLQTEGRCCGVIGPQDFSAMAENRSYPTSCCASEDIIEETTVLRKPLTSAIIVRNENYQTHQRINLSDIPDTSWNFVATESSDTRTISICKAVFPHGCQDRIAAWLRNTADILFVLGYCVIAFLKLCFLGILRYEIREMIQKIKLLQNEMSSTTSEPEIEQQLTQITTTSANGNLLTGNGDRERFRTNSGESEHESLLTPESLPFRYGKNKNYGCTETGTVPTVETDTNSNCALIIEDANTTKANKPINSYNNYELTELSTKLPNYRKSKWPSL